MAAAENMEKFAASEAKMRADGLPDAAILVRFVKEPPLLLPADLVKTRFRLSNIRSCNLHRVPPE